MRKDPSAWFFLGLLPMNMLMPAEIKATQKGHGLRSAKQKLYHNSLHLILKELIDLQSDNKENGTGVAINVAGMGEACSREVPRLVRSCITKWINIDCVNPTCHFVTKEEMYGVLEECMYHTEHGIQVEKYRQKACSVSQCLHIPAFQLVSFGGSRCGIMGATPFE
eukprot:6154978-Ditylum_brightwellii.AAC.1